MADPGFPRRVGGNRTGCGKNVLIWQKVRENERNWTWGGGASLARPMNPPMYRGSNILGWIELIFCM